MYMKRKLLGIAILTTALSLSLSTGAWAQSYNQGTYNGGAYNTSDTSTDDSPSQGGVSPSSPSTAPDTLQGGEPSESETENEQNTTDLNNADNKAESGAVGEESNDTHLQWRGFAILGAALLLAIIALITRKRRQSDSRA